MNDTRNAHAFCGRRWTKKKEKKLQGNLPMEDRALPCVCANSPIAAVSVVTFVSHLSGTQQPTHAHTMHALTLLGLV